MAELPEMKFEVLWKEIVNDGVIRKMIEKEDIPKIIGTNFKSITKLDKPIINCPIIPNRILSPEEFPFGTSTGDITSPDKSMSMDIPEFNNLEKAFSFVQNLPELYQAFLYKALHLNDMRIDRAENMIAKFKP